MAKQQSTGKCSYCEGTFIKGRMSKHLEACDKRMEAAEEVPGAGRGSVRAATLYHIQVEGTHTPMYWMHIEIPSDLNLADLDQFLRDIWLECCGHMSAFDIAGEVYYSSIVESGDKGMNYRLDRVIKPGTQFEHEYDFGTTTYLTLKVIGEREAQVRGQVVQVMARNDPPPWACEVCGKPATDVCAECSYEGSGWLCEEHALEHECGEDMLLPVVNSPRVGMCGYTG